MIIDWFKEQYSKIQKSDNAKFNKEISILISKNDVLIAKNLELAKENRELLATNLALLIDTQELKNIIQDLEKQSIKHYWDNKIKPTKSIMYPARERDINVLNFLNSNNSNTPEVKGQDNDTKANNSLKYVQKNIKYKSDKDIHNKIEFWQYANETMNLKTGDCEDGAILMANIMIKSGIPSWRIRLNAGDVKGGGHCYVTYLREKDNQWYVLDWCYWFTESVYFRKTWQEAKKYFGIWFSWNDYAGYIKPDYNRK